MSGQTDWKALETKLGSAVTLSARPGAGVVLGLGARRLAGIRRNRAFRLQLLAARRRWPGLLHGTWRSLQLRRGCAHAQHSAVARACERNRADVEDDVRARLRETRGGAADTPAPNNA